MPFTTRLLSGLRKVVPEKYHMHRVPSEWALQESNDPQKTRKTHMSKESIPAGPNTQAFHNLRVRAQAFPKPQAASSGSGGGGKQTKCLNLPETVWLLTGFLRGKHRRGGKRPAHLPTSFYPPPPMSVPAGTVTTAIVTAIRPGKCL